MGRPTMKKPMELLKIGRKDNSSPLAEYACMFVTDQRFSGLSMILIDLLKTIRYLRLLCHLAFTRVARLFAKVRIPAR
jgi:hypothetical protein